MSHDLDHHHHAPGSYDRAFAIGIALNLAYVFLEGGFGVAVKSLALVADAGHNLSDVVSLLLAWGASYLSRWQATPRHTYGFRSSTILVALGNALLLLIAVGAIGWEAIQRFQHPTVIPGGTIMGVAAVGIAVNTITALLFMSGRQHDLNLKGAFLHMAADAAVSAGVVGAGFVISLTGWAWIDPAVSLVIVVVITLGTWGLLRDSLNLALQAVPAGIDHRAVWDYLAGLPGVTEVCDLHIWAVSTTEAALTVHLVRPDAAVDDRFLETVAEELHARFDIDHPTVQIGYGKSAAPCPLGASAVYNTEPRSTTSATLK